VKEAWIEVLKYTNYQLVHANIIPTTLRSKGDLAIYKTWWENDTLLNLLSSLLLRLWLEPWYLRMTNNAVSPCTARIVYQRSPQDLVMVFVDTSLVPHCTLNFVAFNVVLVSKIRRQMAWRYLSTLFSPAPTLHPRGHRFIFRSFLPTNLIVRDVSSHWHPSQQ